MFFLCNVLSKTSAEKSVVIHLFSCRFNEWFMKQKTAYTSYVWINFYFFRPEQCANHRCGRETIQSQEKSTGSVFTDCFVSGYSRMLGHKWSRIIPWLFPLHSFIRVHAFTQIFVTSTVNDCIITQTRIRHPFLQQTIF